MSMRDSFSCCQSLYNYLNSENSKHELTHGTINFENFPDYLRSTRLSDSWLIRSLINIPNNEPITENIFNDACNMLDNVQIFDIKNIELLLDKMLADYCYVPRHEMPFQYKKVYKNETNVPKISFSELDTETQNIFLKRTEFDRKLYEKYCTGNNVLI